MKSLTRNRKSQLPTTPWESWKTNFLKIDVREKRIFLKSIFHTQFHVVKAIHVIKRFQNIRLVFWFLYQTANGISIVILHAPWDALTLGYHRNRHHCWNQVAQKGALKFYQNYKLTFISDRFMRCYTHYTCMSQLNQRSSFLNLIPRLDNNKRCGYWITFILFYIIVVNNLMNRNITLPHKSASRLY